MEAIKALEELLESLALGQRRFRESLQVDRNWPAGYEPVAVLDNGGESGSQFDAV